MKNHICSGKVFDMIVAGAVIASGDLRFMGNVPGVAVTDGAIGDVVSMDTEGVFQLPKATGIVIAQGDTLYYDSGAVKITTVATGNKKVGTAFKAELSGATTVQVWLRGSGSASGLAANVAQETTVNGSDAATTQALANALKVKVNAILTALKNAGIMVAD